MPFEDELVAHLATGGYHPRTSRHSDFQSELIIRDSAGDPPGMEAIGIVVVEHDNLAFHPSPEKFATLHQQTRLAPAPPNPKLGDPLHYHSMLQRICNGYTERFPDAA